MSDNLSPQETTKEKSARLVLMGASLRCPGSSALAKSGQDNPELNLLSPAKILSEVTQHYESPEKMKLHAGPLHSRWWCILPFRNQVGINSTSLMEVGEWLHYIHSSNLAC